MRRQILIGALLALAACDGGGGGGGNGGGEDTAPADTVVDTTPPEFRDVRVEILAEPSIPLDLNSKDVERVLPMAFPGTFTVFATDDEAPADSLLVTVLDGDGATVAGQDATFQNGLWTVSVPAVGPGQLLWVRAEDPAGNGLTWDHALVIPTLAEAVTAPWESRFYDAAGTYLHSWHAELAADGTWTEERDDTAEVWTGSWAVEDGRLVLSTATGAQGDQDPATVEHRQEGELYVDETYLAQGPYHREGEGSGVAGTWSRSWKEWAAAGGSLEPVLDVIQTATLEEGGAFHLAFEGPQAGQDDDLLEQSGTWELVPNENYIENYGDYLVLTVTEREGQPVEPPEETVLLVALRQGLLLAQPRVRSF